MFFCDDLSHPIVRDVREERQRSEVTYSIVLKWTKWESLLVVLDCAPTPVILLPSEDTDRVQ